MTVVIDKDDDDNFQVPHTKTFVRGPVLHTSQQAALVEIYRDRQLPLLPSINKTITTLPHFPVAVLFRNRRYSLRLPWRSVPMLLL